MTTTRQMPLGLGARLLQTEIAGLWAPRPPSPSKAWALEGSPLHGEVASQPHSLEAALCWHQATASPPPSAAQNRSPQGGRTGQGDPFSLDSGLSTTVEILPCFSISGPCPRGHQRLSAGSRGLQRAKALCCQSSCSAASAEIPRRLALGESRDRAWEAATHRRPSGVSLQATGRLWGPQGPRESPGLRSSPFTPAP